LLASNTVTTTTFLRRDVQALPFIEGGSIVVKKTTMGISCTVEAVKIVPSAPRAPYNGAPSFLFGAFNATGLNF
jgi:hypothetical protein